MILFELFLRFGIGLSLGLLGSGASLLIVPALVYLVGQTPQTPATTSLAIMGANSMVGVMLIPLGQLSSGLSELDPVHPVAVIRASGNRIQSAAALLGQKGFKPVYNILGGSGAWMCSGLEVKR